MKNNEAIKQRVEQAMNSLDGLSKVDANQFLYGKIQQRITSAKQQTGAHGKWMYSLALMLVVLLVVNVYSYSSFVKAKSQSNGATGIEAFATDYNIGSTADNI